MVIQEPVQAAVWQCLNHYDYNDAIFLAERLFAEVGNEDALYLLALCHYRMGKPQRAYKLLQSKGFGSPECRYIMALSCLDLDKLSEAETIITGGCSLKNKSLDEIAVEFGEHASFAFRILGQVFSKTERPAKAVECFQYSMKLNPFMWSSFESLCRLGAKPDAQVLFQVNAQSLSAICQGNSACPTPMSSSYTYFADSMSPIVESQEEGLQNPAPKDIYIDVATPDVSGVISSDLDMSGCQCFPPSVPVSRYRANRPSRPNPVCIPGYSPFSPSFGILSLELTPNYSQSQLLPSPAVTNAKSGIRPAHAAQSYSNPKPVFSQSGNTNTAKDIQTAIIQQQGYQSNSSGGAGLRRSSRIFSHHASSSVKENNKSQSENKIMSPRMPTKRAKSKLSWTPQQLNEKNRLECAMTDVKMTATNNAHAQMQRQSASALMQLLQELGKAYLALAEYDCHASLELFSAISPQQFNTGWVLTQIGRAHFELSDYQKAENAFSEVRQLEPFRLEGMEIYSTVLWHLQMEVQLSALAQDLVDFDKLSPEAWCATGNCFSLQKEHDVAIRFFQRAMQVDPSFAYAYTLLGHEYVLIEELDKAMAAFRNAVRVDPTHYNAWYGIGMVYYKQEKFALAGVHFQKALTIHPRSSALLCHVGVVQHAMKKSDSALRTLNQAISIEPKNPLCKFHKASILFASDRHKEALLELEELKELVPKESLVYFLLGKVHKKLGNTHLALTNFSWAMDLDPKGTNNHIKETINKRYLTEEDDANILLNDGNEAHDPLEGTSNGSSLMEADDFGLRAAESDESL